MKNILILDGSLHGKGGNTSGVVDELIKLLPTDFQTKYIELKNIDDALTLENDLRKADGFILATGTYWQSWGSPMQRFLEQATDWEATELWLGKPICTMVTMHSVGGMEVSARLQSNFSMFGTIIPPMCTMVYSEVNQIALQSGTNNDLWDLDTLSVIAHNFIAAINKTHDYKSWNVNRGKEVTKKWLKR